MKRESNNKKRKQQIGKDPQQPQPKSGRRATVTIKPNAETKVDIQTGNVSDVEIYYYLTGLTTHFAQRLCNDAEQVVGSSHEEQERYLDWLINQSGLS